MPLFFVANPWALAKVALSAGCHTHGSGADFFKNITCDFSQRYIAFTIQVGLALTLGVGVVGCLSAGLRGAGAITLYIGYEKPGGKQLPRLRVGANSEFDAVIQMLMFKWSSKLYAGAWSTLFDSWDMSVNNAPNQYQLHCSELALGGDRPYTLESNANGAANASADAMARFIESATIVTNGELLARAEVEATATNAAPLGAVAELGAVVPGLSEPFVVTVRNDGNTLLSAGTIDLYRDGSTAPFSSASVGFGASNRVASIHDPELADDWQANDTDHLKYALDAVGQSFASHPLVADDENAVLAPGKTAQFRLSFTIPESWEDEVGNRVKLYAKARDLVAIDPVTLEEICPGANSALGSVLRDLHIPDEACQRSQAAIGARWNVDSSGLRDAPMVASGDGGSSGDGGGGAGGGSGQGSAGGQADKGSGDGPFGALANTGDSCGPVAAGAAALAALGTAFTAYSVRRTAFERGEDGEAYPLE